MASEITKSAETIETMENYISSVRPVPEIRPELDINYVIDGQSITLNEVRPSWVNPEEICFYGFAKTTYVKNKNVWKVFWKRADNKWHSYKPKPQVSKLQDFLDLVEQDTYGCFKG